MKVRVSKSEVKSEYSSFESYLREEEGLRDDVSLDRIKDGGMYGNRDFVFVTDDGEEIVASGYISQPPSATYSMSVYGDDEDALFEG